MKALGLLAIFIWIGIANAVVGSGSANIVNGQVLLVETGERMSFAQARQLMNHGICTEGGQRLIGLNGVLYAEWCLCSTPCTEIVDDGSARR